MPIENEDARTSAPPANGVAGWPEPGGEPIDRACSADANVRRQTTTPSVLVRSSSLRPTRSRMNNVLECMRMHMRPPPSRPPPPPWWRLTFSNTRGLYRTTELMSLACWKNWVPQASDQLSCSSTPVAALAGGSGLPSEWSGLYCGSGTRRLQPHGTQNPYPPTLNPPASPTSAAGARVPDFRRIVAPPFGAVAGSRARGSKAASEMSSFYAGASPQKQEHYQRRRQQIRQERKSLPIASVENRLVDEVRKNGTLIIVGETGSGKTTRRQYPVDILYTYQPESDYLDATLVTIFQIHLEDGPGDILAFLTGQEEIESLERLISERTRLLPPESSKIWTTPIYSSLPSEQQMNAFKAAPAGSRKVVLATNIAETSVTIPGIKYVIDPGMVKARAYNPVTGMESLIIIPVSKAQALQRSGRAGREGPGKCFRLFQESEFDKLVDSTVPEIKRCNLSNVVLQLKALGIDDIIGFDFMEKPSRTAILKSLEQLILLGALTDDYKLSDPVGHQMARLPLDPMYSKALIVSSEFKCLEEMLIVVSMLSVESIFFSPREKLEEARAARKGFESSEGDHITFVNVYRAAAECLEKSKNANAKEKTMEKALNRWCRENFFNHRSLKHARDVHCQIQGHVQQMGLNLSSCGDDMAVFRRCLTASFFLNAAMRQPDGSYRALATSKSVQIHPSSVLFRAKPDCVIFNELVRTTQNYVKNLTRIDPMWLAELSPQYYATED
nr:unnamed protein product [Digitaria exilis]